MVKIGGQQDKHRQFYFFNFGFENLEQILSGQKQVFFSNKNHKVKLVLSDFI